MLAVLLTHADAQQIESPRFRALSDQGRVQVDELAARFRSIVANLRRAPASKQLAIGEIFTSPLARCVETSLRFSDSIKEFTATSEVCIRYRLREQRTGQLSAGDLVSVLDDTRSDVVLICAHGDLAGALPSTATISPKYSEKGWFKVRPVIALVEYERGSNWEEAKVLCCESPANSLQSLLA